MSEILTRLVTTPEGIGALIAGAALFLYMGVPEKIKSQDMFQLSRRFDRRNSTEVALSADPRNSPLNGPVSISQVVAASGNKK